MSKILLFVLVGLLAVTAIMGRASTKSGCLKHGDDCTSSSQCCKGSSCHWAVSRCRVDITEEMLMAQREKILGRRGKDYK